MMEESEKKHLKKSNTMENNERMLKRTEFQRQTANNNNIFIVNPRNA